MYGRVLQLPDLPGFAAVSERDFAKDLRACRPEPLVRACPCRSLLLAVLCASKLCHVHVGDESMLESTRLTWGVILFCFFMFDHHVSRCMPAFLDTGGALKEARGNHRTGTPTVHLGLGNSNVCERRWFVARALLLVVL